jgi:orotate phosphoribosyltransferase
MTQQETLELFEKSEALLKGHFRLTSGAHSNQYLQCAKVLQYPSYSKRLAEGLITKMSLAGKPDAVIGPAIGGITLSYELGRQWDVKTIFSERENGVMALRRGFEIKPGEKLVVVEDVLTTGGSVKEVIDLVEKAGGHVLAVGSICDRSNGKLSFGNIPYFSMMVLDVVKYEPDQCPLCKQGVPLYAPGSRNTVK